MTPETFAAIGALVERYGLPIAILAGLLWLLLTRRLVLGSEANYIEARRVEEREARLAAEALVKSLAGSIETIGDGLDPLTDTILGGIEEALEREARRDARR